MLCQNSNARRHSLLSGPGTIRLVRRLLPRKPRCLHGPSRNPHGKLRSPLLHLSKNTQLATPDGQEPLANPLQFPQSSTLPSLFAQTLPSGYSNIRTASPRQHGVPFPPVAQGGTETGINGFRRCNAWKG